MGIKDKILNLINPSRRNQVRIVKERRNNSLRIFIREGKPSAADKIIPLPNFRFFLEIYDNNNMMKGVCKESEIERERVVWRNPEADRHKPEFLKEFHKSNKNEYGTVFPSKEVARDFIFGNEFFRYLAKDFKLVLDGVHTNKREVVADFTEDLFVAPPLGYEAEAITQEDERYNEFASALSEGK